MNIKLYPIILSVLMLLLSGCGQEIAVNSQLKDAVKDYQITSIKLKFGTDKKDLVDSLSNLSYSLNALSDSEIKKIEAKVGLGFFDDLKTKIGFQQFLWGEVDEVILWFDLVGGTVSFENSRSVDRRMEFLAGTKLPSLFYLREGSDDDNPYVITSYDEAHIRGAISITEQMLDKIALSGKTAWKQNLADLEVTPELTGFLNDVKAAGRYDNRRVTFTVSSNSSQFLAIKDDVELLSKNLN